MGLPQQPAVAPFLEREHMVADNPNIDYDRLFTAESCSVSDGLSRFGDGATRSTLTERHSISPPEARRAVARRWAKGEKTHGPMNYKNGLPIDVVIDHVIDHIMAFTLGERTEEGEMGLEGHLAGAICGLEMVIWYMHNRPEFVLEYLRAHAPKSNL